MSTFDFGSLLLLLAAAVGVVNDRTLRLPRPVVLLLGSLLISLLVIASGAVLGAAAIREAARARVLDANLPSILLDGVLALLLFAGSLHVDLHNLRRRARTVLVLSTLGVVVAAFLFGVAIWLVLGWIGDPVPLGWCLVVGAILAPTDAVAVEGLLAQVRLPPALRAIITGESLFNDGAAVVLFGAMLALAGGRTDMIGHGRLAFAILVEVAGGAALGAAAGYLAYRVTRFTRDDSLALIISLALALATYRAAAAIGVSGPIAVVTAGLVLGTTPAGRPEESGWRAGLSRFWSLIDDLLNTLLYLLMGFEVLTIEFSWRAALAVLVAVPLALLARLISVGAPMLILDLGLPDTGLADTGRAVGILTWSGLRGGVSIALALTLPETPYRNLLLTICAGVVIFTVVVQGLLLPRVSFVLYGPPQPSREPD